MDAARCKISTASRFKLGPRKLSANSRSNVAAAGHSPVDGAQGWHLAFGVEQGRACYQHPGRGTRLLTGEIGTAMPDPSNRAFRMMTSANLHRPRSRALPNGGRQDCLVVRFVDRTGVNMMFVQVTIGSGQSSTRKDLTVAAGAPGRAGQVSGPEKVAPWAPTETWSPDWMAG